MIRKLFLSIALLPLTVSAADYRLTSPDGGIVLEVACGDSLTYRVEAAGEIVHPFAAGDDFHRRHRMGRCSRRS